MAMTLIISTIFLQDTSDYQNFKLPHSQIILEQTLLKT